MQIKIGALLWAQQTDWPALRDAAIAADRAGFDSLWVSDHLLCPIGSWRNPVYEAWATIAGLGALTERATIGTLVGAIPFRNPGLVAKLAATVDHITGGRAVLGLGGAWLAREHHMHGIDFGASAGERLDRLHEAVPLIRGLLDGETVTHSGRFYNLVEAEQFPAAVAEPPADFDRGTGAAAKHCARWPCTPTCGTHSTARWRRFGPAMRFWLRTARRWAGIRPPLNGWQASGSQYGTTLTKPGMSWRHRCAIMDSRSTSHRSWRRVRRRRLRRHCGGILRPDLRTCCSA